MTYNSWLDLKDKISEKFQIEDYQKGILEDMPDSHLEILIFKSQNGKIKLEWISKPRVLGEKTLYSNRIGGNVKVDRIYSPDEKVEFLKAYQEKDRVWEEINLQNFNF